LSLSTTHAQDYLSIYIRVRPNNHELWVDEVCAVRRETVHKPAKCGTLKSINPPMTSTRKIMPPHGALRRHALPCTTMRCHAPPCTTMRRHAPPCTAMPTHNVGAEDHAAHGALRAEHYHATPCNAMQRHATPCNAMRSNLYLFFLKNNFTKNEATIFCFFFVKKRTPTPCTMPTHDVGTEDHSAHGALRAERAVEVRRHADHRLRF
jgi:hypothetical protein